MLLKIRFGILCCAVRKREPTFREIVMPFFQGRTFQEDRILSSQRRKYCGPWEYRKLRNQRHSVGLQKVWNLTTYSNSAWWLLWTIFFFKFLVHLHLNRHLMNEKKFNALTHSVFPVSFLSLATFSSVTANVCNTGHTHLFPYYAVYFVQSFPYKSTEKTK